MNAALFFPLIGAVVLLAILGALLLLGKTRRMERITPLAGLAFGFVLAGLLFGGTSRWIGDGLMGTGMLIALVDIIRNLKRPV